jgi:valyl-tRNA synthetase
MIKELPKNYEPKEVEDNIYQIWEKSGFFNPDNVKGEPYSIMMPPPNVTGVLHLGHSLENSLMDVMARFQRMQGKKVLLLPGTDHAAIATQAKVEKNLAEKGIKNPREDLGREKLLEEIRKYAENSKSTILKQIRKMGTSCDWSRLAYTFDEKRSAAVNEVFVRMYNDNLIYKGYRVINWSVKGQSTCSDDELEYKEQPAKLYTFKYSKNFPIAIATTRPETKLGDTAVAVNPNDKRYKDYIGKTFSAEVGAKNPLKIKIIADETVDPNFGTGALGVTPAHSAVDFEMYEKQKAAGFPIDIVQVIDEKGLMNKNAGEEYSGLTIKDAREKFVTWLKENSLLEKEEEITHSVGTSDRFGDVVEALPMTQWFIDVNKKIPGKEKSLKELMHDVVANGHNNDPEQKIKITPDRYEKIYFNWIENLRDWCISRQIWWGHQIPVWYRGDERYCGTSAPKDDGWQQDPDTLDTWFSSGLWTFSTLGWPKNTTDLKTFHPSNWMQMGYEILFFWMARMVLMTTYSLDTIPFKDVYIHGILRDEKGNKFSKSSGNNLDPIEIIDRYGCDALRLSLIISVSPGNDSRFYEEKVESSRNFVTKLWNIARYILSSYTEEANKPSLDEFKPSDVWILQKFSTLIKDVKNDFDKFQFSQAAEKLREFTWSDLADWYLEVSKFDENKEVKGWILNNIFEDLLKMWHPFIPFITENIWKKLDKKNLLMIEKWPDSDVYNLKMEDWKHENYIRYFDLLREAIIAIRNIRLENTINLKTKLTVIIRIKTAGNSLFKDVFELEKETIKKLRTGVESLAIEVSDDIIEDAYHVAISDGNLYVLRTGLIDVEKEKEKAKREITDIENYLAKVDAKLGDKQVLSKASGAYISKLKKTKKHNEDKLIELKKYFASIK